MLKIISVRVKEPYQLVCKFNTNEVKVLNALPILENQAQLDGISSLLNEELFSCVELGIFGELCWKKIVNITYQGVSTCWDFDISPEYAYEHSELITEAVA